VRNDGGALGPTEAQGAPSMLSAHVRVAVDVDRIGKERHEPPTLAIREAGSSRRRPVPRALIWSDLLEDPHALVGDRPPIAVVKSARAQIVRRQ